MRAQNRQRPYFSQDQVESIIESFEQSMLNNGLFIHDKLLVDVRKYVTSAKNEYENAILYGVLEKHYSFVVKDGIAAFEVQDSLPSYQSLKYDSARDKTKLTFALNQIAVFGREDALKIGLGSKTK